MHACRAVVRCGGTRATNNTAMHMETEAVAAGHAKGQSLLVTKRSTLDYTPGRMYLIRDSRRSKKEETAAGDGKNHTTWQEQYSYLFQKK